MTNLNLLMILLSFALLLLIVSFLHGILSGNKPAMMTGKAAWLCLLILLVLSLFRKRMGTAAWLRLHRVLSVLLCALIAVHILHAVLL